MYNTPINLASQNVIIGKYIPYLFCFSIICYITRDALPKLNLAIEEWNQQDGLSFCITLGDIIDGNDTAELTEQDFTYVLTSLEKLKHKCHHVLGNHCLNHPKGKPFVSESLQQKGYYYVAEILKGYWIIVLDGTEVSARYSEPGSENHKAALKWLDEHPLSVYPNAELWNSGISKTQISWLKEQLEAAKRASEKALVFCHYPLKKEAAAPTHLLWNSDEVDKALEEYSDVVKGYFCGHYHEGGFYYDMDRKLGYFSLDAILSSQENAYGYVDVYEDHIEVRGRCSMRSLEWKI